MRTTFSIRLPPELEHDARQRAQRLGVSVNALVCVALDAYLRAPAPVMVSAPPSVSDLSSGSGPMSGPLTPENRPAAPAVPPGLSRAERRRLKRQQAM